jgi:hypothetical protein
MSSGRVDDLKEFLAEGTMRAHLFITFRRTTVLVERRVLKVFSLPRD